MSPDLAYFIKVNVAFVLFYAFYRLFFYRDTFFKLRRMILLIFFAAAFFYPLFNVQDWVKEQEPIAEVISLYSAMLPEFVVESAPAPEVDWKTIIAKGAVLAYWSVIILLTIRLFIQLGSIVWLAVKSKSKIIFNRKVYIHDRPSGPFSFFRFVFLSREDYSPNELKEILEHEYTHVSQWHSIDVVISEIITIICWMNPFVWLLKREVRHNLEYLADRKVLDSGYDPKSYQYHLLGLAHHTDQAAADLYNNFNVLHLKNRISMMNKKRSHSIGRAKCLIFVPLIMLLMLLSNIEAIARVTKDLATSLNTDAEMEELTELVLRRYNLQTHQDKQKPLTVVDHMPVYAGGEEGLLQYIAKSVKYPVEAQQKGIKGRVICVFTVNTDGSVSETEVVRGVDPLLDAEAVRVIEAMPPWWTPGRHKGENVRVKFTVPITFALNQTDNTTAQSNAGKDEIEIADNSDPANPVYRIADHMPVFPGGESELLKFIATSVKYPVEAQQKGIKGRVICSYIVEKDGSLSNYKIVRGIDPLLDEEALRVMKTSPKWTPGKVDGKDVRVLYTVPITFRLQ